MSLTIRFDPKVKKGTNIQIWELTLSNLIHMHRRLFILTGPINSLDTSTYTLVSIMEQAGNAPIVLLPFIVRGNVSCSYLETSVEDE